MNTEANSWKLKAGSLVWANEQPALVLPNNKLSYFNFKPRHIITPTTRLVPFSSPANLRALFPTLTDPALRNFTLKLWARYIVIQSLTCKCIILPKQGTSHLSQTFEFSNRLDARFEVRELLTFLRRLAVRPSVQDHDTLEAVTVAAQLKAVRTFFVKNQTSHFTHSSSDAHAMKEYQKTSSLKENLNSSDRVEEQLTSSAILRNSFRSLHSDHLSTFSNTGIKLDNGQSLQYLLACLRIIASNPFGFVEEEERLLNTVKPSFLRFRNISYKNISGHCFSNCSHGNGETHVPCPELHGVKTHTKAADDKMKKSGNGKISSFIVPSIKSCGSFGLKRKYIQNNSLKTFSKLRKTASFNSCKEVEEHLQRRPSREATTDFCSKSCPNENGELNLTLPPQTSVKAQKKLQPGRLASSDLKAKILHMKFPRDFHLPSKEELVKKFSSFGPVDASKTELFPYAGSAQVAFLHETNAVVAYLYAKRKKLFGQTNVLFWLDPFKNKRKANEVSVYASSLSMKHPGLKSCLKRSKTLEKGVEKKPCSVRFRMETS